VIKQHSIFEEPNPLLDIENCYPTNEAYTNQTLLYQTKEQDTPLKSQSEEESMKKRSRKAYTKKNTTKPSKKEVKFQESDEEFTESQQDQTTT
jgi:hypothetical protein